LGVEAVAGRSPGYTRACLEIRYVLNLPDGGVYSRIVINPFNGHQIIYIEGSHLSPDGRMAAYTDGTGILTVDDLIKQRMPTKGYPDGVNTPQWSADSRYLAVQTRTSEDNTTLDVYDASDPQPLFSVPTRLPLSLVVNSMIAVWSPVTDQIAYFNQSADG